jgi:glycosyltransferase involved in cell wall biosynthesis
VRILHVVPSYLPATRYGGPITSVHGLCAALARRGHDVHVFTTSVDGPTDSAVAHGVAVELEGVAVTYFRSRRLRRLYWAPAMGHALAERLAGFDVLHTHSVFLWPTTAAARAAHRAGVPYVLAPRGMLVPELIAARSRLLKRAWIALHERRNLRRAAAIHVTSGLERRDCLRCGIRHDRFVELPNGVWPMDRPAPGTESPAIRSLVAAGPFFLFLGRLSWKKGIDRLLAAMRDVAGARLLIAGPDDEGLRAELEGRAAALGIASRVTFTGAVSGPDKAALLHGCLALAAPSSSENFGNVVLEAMAAGRPAITTPAVGLADTLVRHECGLVVDGSPEALAEALGALSRNPAMADAMGARGRRVALAELSWDSVAGRAETTYAELIATRPRRPAAAA